MPFLLIFCAFPALKFQVDVRMTGGRQCFSLIRKYLLIMAGAHYILLC
jgi:hypothetical protein